MIWWLLACVPDLGERSAAAHAGRCGDCHVEHAEAFSASRHACASSSEVFVALRDRAEATQGLSGFCDGCHAPRGLDCLSCHAAAGNRRPANGELLHDPTGPILGPTGEGTASHAIAMGDFLLDSELCATCHEVDGPGALVESPWTHWKGSVAAAEGVGCRGCHLSATPGVDGPAVAEGHAFVGLQVDPVGLLAAGLQLDAAEGGVWAVNRSGHRLPDGAAFTRELWLERLDGDEVVEVVPLHPQLLGDDGVVWDPLEATGAMERGLDVDEERWLAAEVGQRWCLRFRGVAEPLAEGLGVEVPGAVTVGCAVAR